MGRYSVKPKDSDIDDVLNICTERANSGNSPLWGMTYEEGVEAGIRWVLGQTDDSPLD